MSDSNETISLLCDSFLENREVLRSYFGREDVPVYPTCAAVFTERQKAATEEHLIHCREVLKSGDSPSEFRGAAIVPVICIMAADENPHEKLHRAQACFGALRETFSGSPYLAMTSLVASDMLDESQYGELSARAGHIHDLLCKRRFLTEDDDGSMAATFLAAADLFRNPGSSQSEAVWNTEVCFTELTNEFFLDDAIRAQSVILAYGEGDPKERAARMMELYEIIHKRNSHLGDGFDSGVFAFLSLLPGDLHAIANDVFAAEKILAKRKGYTGIRSLNKTSLLIHSAMMAAIKGVFENDFLWEAQKATMCIAMAAMVNNL